MKTKYCDPNELFANYIHPSAGLFRAIELKAIHDLLYEVEFQQPSLDLGCGDGLISSMIFDEKFVYGVDNGEAEDVEEAIVNERYKKVFLESAESLTLTDSSVNFVFSNCVIEHIPDNNAVLSEVNRVLNPGGSFVFTVPSDKFPDYLYLTNKFASLGLSYFSRFYKYRRNKMLNQFHCYGIEDWRRRLELSGFNLINSRYYMSKSALMLWDKMALRIFLRRMLGGDSRKKTFEEYRDEIFRLIADDCPAQGEGAGLLIHCSKN